MALSVKPLQLTAVSCCCNEEPQSAKTRYATLEQWSYFVALSILLVRYQPLPCLLVGRCQDHLIEPDRNL